MARQEWNNGAAYLEQRTKLNEMTAEIYRLKSEGRVVFLDDAADAADADGSESAPFEFIDTAVHAVNAAEGGTVNIYPGTYGFGGGTLDIPPNVSLVNPHGRGQVTLITSVVIVNTDAQLERLTMTPAYDMRIGDTEGVGLVESIVCKDCDFVGTGQYHGGDSGTDSFIFLDCVFGLSTAGFRTVRFTGSAHIIESMFIDTNIDVRFGSTTPIAAPFTFIKITNSVISPNSIVIEAYDGKAVSLIIFNTEFTTPITFDIDAGNAVNINIDLLSYNSAVNAGTDFSVTGLTVNIIDLPSYDFTDTIINETIIPTPNPDPLPGDFQDVAQLVVPLLQAGLYEIKLSQVWNITDITDALIWHTIGAVVSPQFQREAADDDDVQTWTYVFPLQWDGGPFDLILQAVVENGGQDATIQAANIILERKG